MNQTTVITGIERKRRFTDPERIAILEESQLPSSSLMGIARKYGISPSVLHLWKKKFLPNLPATNSRGGVLGDFVKVLPPPASEADQCIRIHFNGEILVELPLNIEPKVLVTFLTALRG